MRFRGYLFFISMLFFVLFSTSFVCASEITQDNTSEIIALSDDVGSVDYGQSCSINSNSVDQSSDSILGLANNGQNTNEFENDSTYNEEPEQLRLSIDEEPILGAYDVHLSSGTVENIRDKILDISDHGGGTLYLDGGTYTGTSKILAGSYDESAGDRPWDGDRADRPDKVYISNVRIYGGYQLGDGIMANVGDGWDYALTFGVKNSKSPLIPASNNTKRGCYSNYGCILTNITFENLNTTRVVNFVSGSLTNCSINNCISKNQFMGMMGCYWDNTPISVKNCNFTNCHQTNPGEDYVKDGSGQLGAVFGIAMENCNFVNTSSAQHGGALCIADESDWGSGAVASKLKNCNFINITSRWFAIYIHGNFSSSFGWIDEPEIIDGCYFLNCTGTGEYSGAIGISHDNLIVKNSEFVNCSGGQGAAIMVGGLDGDHDGFSGRNYKGNNVTLENCIFTDNVATLNKTSSYCNGIYGWDTKKPREPDKYTYYNKTGENEYIEWWNGTYYNKHAPRWFYPSGNAGAVFVEGNDTKIINCTFNRNEAESGSGAAVYITGQRTIVNNSKFYDHESTNGTVFIKGNNATFFNNTFINNNATNGAGIYVEGANATILNSTFKENEADYGAGIYIIGNNVRVSGFHWK
ncbi:right-handed parallel beta-helix repeat-containing protein [uncultured Methanobrevibacter sp.]|uniref:right-handed parallel beta-helix repeat-containing protein n=1 Tax=uncultured Methanobrevibacter sp. TaxID=253161 RepID=UPI0025D408AB|nr:right-handed parallel beta-helix repeat-containing protein [uncultured Methanobrevibacter sp.]